MACLTEIETSGPAVEASLEDTPLARWLAERGLEAHLIVCRKDGQELTQEDLAEAVALVAAAWGD